MLFYVQMRWNIEGRLTLDQALATQQAESTSAGDLQSIVSMYKVAGQRRVIAIVEYATAEDLDRVFMKRLPLRDYLEIETIWPVRPFQEFLADCITQASAGGAEDDPVSRTSTESIQ